MPKGERKIAFVLLVAWLLLIGYAVVIYQNTNRPVIQFWAQEIVQPQISLKTVPIFYTIEIHTLSKAGGGAGIYAGEPINVTVLVHSSNVTTLMKYFCCVGFLYAQSTTNGFLIEGFGNIGWLNLTADQAIKGAYQAFGQIYYPNPAEAYAFLIPDTANQVMTMNQSMIQSMPTIWTVNSESDLIVLQENAIFLELTVVLIAFGVLALQPILSVLLPDEKTEDATESKKPEAKESQDAKTIPIQPVHPGADASVEQNLQSKGTDEEKQTAQADVEK